VSVGLASSADRRVGKGTGGISLCATGSLNRPVALAQVHRDFSQQTTRSQDEAILNDPAQVISCLCPEWMMCSYVETWFSSGDCAHSFAYGCLLCTGRPRTCHGTSLLPSCSEW